MNAEAAGGGGRVQHGWKGRSVRSPHDRLAVPHVPRSFPPFGGPALRSLEFDVVLMSEQGEDEQQGKKEDKPSDRNVADE